MIKQIHNADKLIHGGDLTAATKEFGKPAYGWIDLSTGINPNSYPNTQVSKIAFKRLPLAGELDKLAQAALQYYRVPLGNHILVAPGTQSILQNIPILYPGRKVTILSPTYSEHQNTWAQTAAEISPVENIDSLSQGQIGVVVNPNNPNGKSYKIAKLLQLAKNLELLIIDEAFCDCTPDQSIIPHLQTYNILVLRSLGKFFGLAGLRLGFVIGTIENIEPIKTRLGPWAVSGPAIEIGQRALSDVAWITQMHERLDLHSNRLNQVLLQKHLHIIGSTKLFKLVENKYASEIYRILCESGILVRQFEENKDWLRIGLPGPENEWRRLDAALDLCLNTVNNMSK